MKASREARKSKPLNVFVLTRDERKLAVKIPKSWRDGKVERLADFVASYLEKPPWKPTKSSAPSESAGDNCCGTRGQETDHPPRISSAGRSQRPYHLVLLDTNSSSSATSTSATQRNPGAARRDGAHPTSVKEIPNEALPLRTWISRNDVLKLCEGPGPAFVSSADRIQESYRKWDKFRVQEDEDGRTSGTPERESATTGDDCDVEKRTREKVRGEKDAIRKLATVRVASSTPVTILAPAQFSYDA